MRGRHLGGWGKPALIEHLTIKVFPRSFRNTQDAERPIIEIEKLELPPPSEYSITRIITREVLKKKRQNLLKKDIENRF